VRNEEGCGAINPYCIADRDKGKCDLDGGRRKELVEWEGGFVFDKWFSFWPEHPRLLELAMFLSQALDLFLHFHVMSRGELSRQGVHLLTEQVFD
jgi:hypothetical protein